MCAQRPTDGRLERVWQERPEVQLPSVQSQRGEVPVSVFILTAVEQETVLIVCLYGEEHTKNTHR